MCGGGEGGGGGRVGLSTPPRPGSLRPRDPGRGRGGHTSYARHPPGGGGGGGGGEGPAN